MSFVITLQDFDEGTEYTVEVSEEEYNKIMSGDNELANKYLQREIERKNRLLAYQLLLNAPKTIQKSNSELAIDECLNDPNNVVETNSTSRISELELHKNDSNFTQRWNENETKKLIELYRDNFEKLHDRKYKAKIIYSEMAKHFDRFTCEQIESKIKNLKKTYKIILDNSNKTGRGRITWPYFNILQEIFGNKPENSPLSIASSRSGFEQNSIDSSINSDSDSEIPTKMLKCNPEVQPIAGPSRLKESNCTKKKVAVATSSKGVPEPEWVKGFRSELAQQHKEKMDKQQQFLDLFKEWVSKPKE